MGGREGLGSRSIRIAGDASRGRFMPTRTPLRTCTGGAAERLAAIARTGDNGRDMLSSPFGVGNGCASPICSKKNRRKRPTALRYQENPREINVDLRSAGYPSCLAWS